MQPRKPVINTKGLQIREFSQLKMIAGKPEHADGICGPLAEEFADLSIGKKPLDDFHSESKSLFSRIVAITDKHNAAARAFLDGAEFVDPTESVFTKHGLFARSNTVAHDKLSSQFKQKGVYLLKYPYKSGDMHQMTFSQSHGKCTLFDPNRFIASGSCPLVKKTMLDIVARSEPSTVKIITGVKQS